jgi:tetratricopeptide (TPR) repeat protein
VAYSQTGRQSEALQQYAEALRQNPADPEIRTNLGMTYTTLGRYDDAIAEYERALEINPRYAAALRNLERLVLHRIDSFSYASRAERDEFISRMHALALRHGADHLAREIERRSGTPPTR